MNVANKTDSHNFSLQQELSDHNAHLDALRNDICANVSADEREVIDGLVKRHSMTVNERESAFTASAKLVSSIRTDEKPGLMEVFLTEYGLSTSEGVALMCLAEALLRVPDADTIDSLIEDKLISSNWRDHVGESPSALVNTATYGLIVTSNVLSNPSEESLTKLLKQSIKRLGSPVIRSAVKRAMKEMGHQFVLGETIESALKKGAKAATKGYTYSFDMLGEAAITQTDADTYFESYQQAILKLGSQAVSSNMVKNPGISIKLSALHPRYEILQRDRVLTELVPSVIKLALMAKELNLGLNIDAEEADRLDISLDVIQAVLKEQALENWTGFGVVVQAYNKSAEPVIDWLYCLAKKHNRKIMLRLVKGAYWDTEIKHAQVEGVDHYPVFTQKNFTDVSYLCCAKKLLRMSDTIYPQFATHNAHTVASIIEIAKPDEQYEFQRLHGMGENVYRQLVEQQKIECRIYAPVGEHRDLLAYLVRRLLENGANSSFVNQIVDLNVPIEKVVTDPFLSIEKKLDINPLPMAPDLFQPERQNSKGTDLHDRTQRRTYLTNRLAYETRQWRATPLLSSFYVGDNVITITNPSNISDTVGEAIEANSEDVNNALTSARDWSNSTASQRAKILNLVANSLEDQTGKICALLAREAGKTAKDCIAELREAVDFLRYYAAQAERESSNVPLGVFVCISPWNFPLAIFIGQICAALACGNGVIAKPAESTPLIAFFAIKLFHKAGVPRDVLQLLIGDGATIGAPLVSSSKIAGVCFTGSTQTGLRINRSMSEKVAPNAPLIAETGGLNAMIVDSTALPEQAVKDIVKSAFQSAGQRCSALRLLYLQEDIYDSFLSMLFGAMDELKIGDAWNLDTDIGPLISAQAKDNVEAYLDKATMKGSLLKRLCIPTALNGQYIAPSVVEIKGIQDMHEEVFAPVLHIAKFSSGEFSNILKDINNSNYGLTFGLHSRIDARAAEVSNTLHVGNMYINRDQIGAVVGSQPFGGENLSGTGPKAGGPSYLQRFCKPSNKLPNAYPETTPPTHSRVKQIELNDIQTIINSIELPTAPIKETVMPGPTGEQNTLYQYARGIVLCLGPSLDTAQAQAEIALQKNCVPVIACPGAKGQYTLDGFLPRELLMAISGVHVFALWDSGQDAIQARKSLAKRDGPILPLSCDLSLVQSCVHERHVCIDTTAAGGNASLLAVGF